MTKGRTGHGASGKCKNETCILEPENHAKLNLVWVVIASLAQLRSRLIFTVRNTLKTNCVHSVAIHLLDYMRVAANSALPIIAARRSAITVT